MKRRNIALALSTTLAVIGLSGVTTGADSNFDGEEMDVLFGTISVQAVARRLERVNAELDSAHTRLMRLIDAGPSGYPPDPCSDPRAPSCQAVRATEAIDAQAESLLASVAVLDHGADRAALARRLSYSTATFAWASTRLASLTQDWSEARPEGLPPSEYPPDPCQPSIVANVELVTAGAEFADRRIGRIDTCSAPASLDRRLGHVVVGLDSVASRLDALAAVGFNPQPDPPGSPVDRELDAVIARAEYVASTARALKSTGGGVLISE